MSGTIEVVWGTGVARTELGAFDRALADANVHQYNLVTLSSVVPRDVTVRETGSLEPGRWPVGSMVAVVSATNTGTDAGHSVAAGLGWRLAASGGVFVEATAETAAECEDRLTRRLEDVAENRDWTWEGEARTRVVETTVETAAASFVGAVYRSLPFDPVE